MMTTSPNGTRDFGSQDCKIRSQIFEKLRKVAEKHVFHLIETPAFERIETMQGKYGEENEKLIFKILKRGEQASTGECDLALRYDLTVPAMRYYVSNKRELPKIFKRYQYGPVWRADRPGKGRYRQFYQFDFDIYGSSALTADIECLNILVECLDELGIKDFHVRLNSRPILRALMEEFDVPEHLYPIILIQIDKIDKTGVVGLSENLNPYKEIGKIAELAQIFLNDNYNVIFLDRISARHENKPYVKELQDIMATAEAFINPTQIKIDMTLARGLDYYTGPIYEIEIPGVKGSIAAGGRYDNLSKLFSNEAIPVCGASLGIERIIPLVDISTLDINHAVDIYIANSGDEFKQIYQLSVQLRKLGYSVEIQQGSSGKFRKELSYANQIGALYFLYQGEEEKENFFIKDMQNACIEETYSYVQVIDFLKRNR